jgi:hypothetical protein
MAFTAAELTNIANASLDYYLNRGDTFKQSIQNKPLLEAMERINKTFPGGKGNISLAIKGIFGAAGVNDGVVGYTHNDTVNFYTPANINRVNYPWREHHIGLTLTHTELKIDGISVTDEAGDGARTEEHSGREMTVLVNLLADKLQDFGEQYARTMNTIMWSDGTADPKALAGMQAIIVDSPSVGTLGGLTRTTNTWWRNRAATAANGTAGGQGPVTSNTASGGALLTFLQNEWRQLIRYGGRPNKCLAGSSFISAMETEIRANGNYSLRGFKGPQDGAMGQMSFNDVSIEYDPTLDDLGHTKRGYFWDTRHIYLMKMEDEWRHTFTPARQYNQFVLYKSMTCTGQMVAQQVNSAAVYDIA